MTEDNNNINLKEISQQVHKHEYIDGFNFIFIGFMLFIAAGIINLHPVFSILFFVSFIAFISLGNVLRARFTFPRLGYFKVKTDDPKKVIPGMILFTSAIIISFIILLIIFTGDDPRNLYDFETWYRFLPVLFGLIMFGPSLDLVDKTGQKIFYSLGVFSTLLGLLIVWMNFQNAKFGFTIYLLLLGSISLIIGFITFVRFITNYPILTNSENLDIQEDDHDS